MTDPLITAIRAVRDELQAGEAFDDAVAFVAEEQGVNPVLLARKVRESAGAMCPLPAQPVKREPARFRTPHSRLDGSPFVSERLLNMLIASLRETR